MKIGDKATESVACDLASQLTSSIYELITDDLTHCDDLTPEGDFPQFGDFLEVNEYSPVDGTDRGARFIELTSDLAHWLIDNELDDGDQFRVLSHSKTDGEHRYEVRQVAPDE
jgi:hypothetical protein